MELVCLVEYHGLLLVHLVRVPPDFGGRLLFNVVGNQVHGYAALIRGKQTPSTCVPQHTFRALDYAGNDLRVFGIFLSLEYKSCVLYSVFLSIGEGIPTSVYGATHISLLT
jgi:hypothetical protein